MQQGMRWMYAVLPVIAGLTVPGCQRASATHEKVEPAHVEPIEGSELRRVTFSEKAMERIGIETAAVVEKEMPPSPAGNSSGGDEDGTRKAVPYSALLYDANGNTWVYTTPKARTFVRHQVEVDSIREDLAYLSGGPPIGTEVVTVGAAEVYGTEFEVGH